MPNHQWRPTDFLLN
nr:unnamed protein product [Callosobruchus chinensis]